MAIKYFPNRVFKKSPAAIDRVMAKRTIRVIRGYKDVSADPLDTYVSANSDWHLNSIKLNFSNTSSRSYSVCVASGLKVVTDLNDSLWFLIPGTLWQQIVLRPGFYTGTTLADELKIQLDANTTYAAKGLNFTVVYNVATGLFTITPSSGTIKYIQTNNTQQLSDRDSTGGHLFGLTADTNSLSAISSDTVQFGLDSEAWIIDEDNNTVTEHFNDDIHIFSIDQALHFATNVASTAITYEVVYEEIV